jgi:hypothetical protein
MTMDGSRAGGAGDCKYEEGKIEVIMDASCVIRDDHDEKSHRVRGPGVLESMTSMGESVTEALDILAKCIIVFDSKGHSHWNGNPILDACEEASAESGILVALQRTRVLPVDETPDGLAAAAASNDIAAVGRLLGPRDVDAVWFEGRNLPESLVRRPLKCSLLDVAIGSGSVEMTKYLLEFHRAKPTQDTLKQALSAGSFESIKLIRERLPEAEGRDRQELLAVAAEAHQPEVLRWLLRDITVFERELLLVFTLERKLADSSSTTSMVAFERVFVLGGTARVRWRCSGGRVRSWSWCLRRRDSRQRADGGLPSRVLSRLCRPSDVRRWECGHKRHLG